MKKYKQYPWKFKISKNRIEWWQSEVTLGSDYYFYYILVDSMDKECRDAWNEEDGTFSKGWMRKIFGGKTVGLHKFWYDGPHAQLNLYWICIGWSTPWTKMPSDYWN